jgi:hypothetical protein
MASELPYFRFTVQEWQNGNVSLERYELQGFFISVCGYYWMQDCTTTLAMLCKKFSNATAMLQELIDLGIIKHEKRHDKVEIVFLNKQYDLLSENRKSRQDAGSKGGKAKAKLQQKPSYKDNNKDKDKDNNIYREFMHLKITQKEVDALLQENSIDEITAVLDSIQNYKKNKNYTSLFLTAKNWLKRENKKSSTTPEKLDRTSHNVTQMQKTFLEIQALDNYEANR